MSISCQEPEAATVRESSPPSGSSPAGLALAISKRAVFRALLITVAVIHLFNAVALWLRTLTYDFWGRDPFIDIFSVSGEGKIPTWYSSCTLLACGVLLAVIGFAKWQDGNRYRFHWVGLAVIFAGMSLDEATAIHEMTSSPLQSKLHLKGALMFAWVIPGTIVVVGLGLLYLKFLLHLPDRSRNLFIIAGAVYVFGVLGMEFVGSAYYAKHQGNLIYGIIASIEEVLEMTGIALFIYALLDYLGSSSAKKISVAIS